MPAGDARMVFGRLNVLLLLGPGYVLDVSQACFWSTGWDTCGVTGISMEWLGHQ